MDKLYAYIRVDPKELNSEAAIDKQKQTIRGEYNESKWRISFIIEIDSGENFDRSGWKELKKIVQPGERITVASLQILSSTTLPTTIKELETFRNQLIDVDVLELRDNQLIQSFTGMYGHFEKIRLERQLGSIDWIAKNEAIRKFKYPGRQTILGANLLDNIKTLMRYSTNSPTELGRRLGISRSTVYKALKLLYPETTESGKNESIV